MLKKIVALTLTMSVMLSGVPSVLAAPLPEEDSVTLISPAPEETGEPLEDGEDSGQGQNDEDDNTLPPPGEETGEPDDGALPPPEEEMPAAAEETAVQEETGTPPEPTSGPYLDAEVFQSYRGVNATYGDKGSPDTVMSSEGQANPGEMALNGNRRSLVTFQLDEMLSEDDWNLAVLDIVNSHGGTSYENVTVKAYLVEDYDLDTVTWNTLPAKLEGTPECTFSCGAGKYTAVRCDVTRLIKWAKEQGLDHVNIALEHTGGGQTWYGSERYTDSGKPDMPVGSYTPMLNLLVEEVRPPEASAGDLLDYDYEVVWEADGSSSTYADADNPDMVMSESELRPDEIVIVPNKDKGLISFELDEDMKNLDWDAAALELVKVDGSGFDEAIVRSYLVEDYDLNTVTWNTFPEKLEGTPEIDYYGGGYKQKTTRYDLSELIRWAIDQGLTRVNIAIEGVELLKRDGIWHGTERYEGDLPRGSYTPALKLLRVPDDERFTIKDGDRVMLPGETRFLEYVDVDEKEPGSAAFSSSDESVATVTEDGILQSVGVGTAAITLTAQDGRKTSIQVTVEEDDMAEDFRVMRQRWLDILTITESNGMSLENEYVRAYVDNLSASAMDIWNTMHKSDDKDREYLWDLTNTSGGEPVKQQFRKLKTLAQAFVTEGTELYGNLEVARELVDSLEFMTGTGDYPGGGWRYDGVYPESGNWWDWQIGAAQPFCDVLMMMEKYLDDREVMRYTGIIGQYAREADCQISVGGSWGRTDSANLTDSAVSVMAQGILREDSEKIKLCIQQTPKAMKIKEGYASFGEGRYEDGSFIAHGRYAYNGGYGADALKGVARISNLVAGTEFDFPEDVINKWYDFSVEGYLPLLYKGKMMTMVDGRSISRKTDGGMEIDWGKRVMSDLLVLAKNSPDLAFKQTVQSVIKYNIEGSLAYYDQYALARDFEALCNIINLMEDDSIVAMPVEEGIKMYGAMCRVVQTTDKYTVGIAMTRKDHIASFENTNGEGLKQWHFNAGNLFVYNNDLLQYGEAYYPTIDNYRLPGLTADTAHLEDGYGNQQFPDTTTAGGANDGEIAAIAYSYSGTYLDQEAWANKSYFLMEDGIVQMGTDIHGTTEATIETTVENRMLKEDGSNQVLINGEVFDGQKTTLDLPAGSWIHLEGNCEGADMAYYFPKATQIEIQKEQRTGSYAEINSGKPDTPYTQWYLKIGINHGTGTVENGEYLYVTLPGMSVEEVKAYAASSPVIVADSSKDAHVIRYRDGKVLAINYWGSEPYQVGRLTLDAEEGSSPASSVIVTEDNGVYTLSIADPNYADAVFKLSTADAIEVISKDDAITVVDEKTILADMTDAGGHSAQISFTIKGEMPETAEAIVNWSFQDTADGKTLTSGTWKTELAVGEKTAFTPDMTDGIPAGYRLAADSETSYEAVAGETIDAVFRVEKVEDTPDRPPYVPNRPSDNEEIPDPDTPTTEQPAQDIITQYSSRDNKGLWTQYKDGSWAFLAGGSRATGWQLIDSVWYYFLDDGMMATGWQLVDGTWYYLKDWGGMATGWQLADGVWYYLKDWGGMATGWLQVDSKWYYLNSSGAMQTGWVQVNGTWYYLYSDGSMAANTSIDGWRVDDSGAWIES